MYITVSTGVGGGWILNGRPWRGAEGMAGNGHMVVDPVGPLACVVARVCRATGFQDRTSVTRVFTALA